MPHHLPQFSRVLLALVAIGAIVSAAAEARGGEQPGQQVASAADLVVPTDEGGTRQVASRYWLYLPADYSATGENTWPLLLFLHGSGEKVDDLELVKKHGPPKLLQQEAQQKAWPFITISPQCPKETRWNAAELAKLVEHVANTYRVDRRRIHVTGLLAEKP